MSGKGPMLRHVNSQRAKSQAPRVAAHVPFLRPEGSAMELKKGHHLCNLSANLLYSPRICVFLRAEGSATGIEERVPFMYAAEGLGWERRHQIPLVGCCSKVATWNSFVQGSERERERERGLRSGNLPELRSDRILAMEDSGVERSEEGGLGLGDMPELCIARILAFTTPKDVCRLAAVSQLFRRVANSEATWEAMLPPNYRNIISEAANPIVLPSKKELYFHLCNSILIEAGRKRIWLERSTGKICYMLSARDLTIIWGSDDRYWRWVSRGDSRFEQVAELLAVCWLEVKGRIECARLSPNTVYAVSFVLKIADHHYGLENIRVKFSVAAEHGERQISARCLVESEGEGSDDEAEETEYAATPVRYGEDGWMEFVAGVFSVEKSGDEPSYVEFRLDGVVSGDWKSGLILDGVKIEPRA